ncbi:MAG TPA: hypothetical protein VI959_00875, partial [Alphaproteobacteria bacterium]|nr:hypothetical protein [Alphaproteobacteria bacterium]
LRASDFFKVKRIEKTNTGQDEGLLFKWFKSSTNGEKDIQKQFVSFSSFIPPQDFAYVTVNGTLKEIKWKIHQDLDITVLKDGSMTVKGLRESLEPTYFSSSNTLYLENFKSKTLYAKAKTIKSSKYMGVENAIFKLKQDENFYETTGESTFETLKILKGKLSNSKTFTCSKELFVKKIINKKEGFCHLKNSVRTDDVENYGTCLLEQAYLKGINDQYGHIKNFVNTGSLTVENGSLTVSQFFNEKDATTNFKNSHHFSFGTFSNKGLLTLLNSNLRLVSLKENTGVITLLGDNWSVGYFESRDSKKNNFSLHKDYTYDLGKIFSEKELYFREFLRLKGGDFYAPKIEFFLKNVKEFYTKQDFCKKWLKTATGGYLFPFQLQQIRKNLTVLEPCTQGEAQYKTYLEKEKSKLSAQTKKYLEFQKVVFPIFTNASSTTALIQTYNTFIKTLDDAIEKIGKYSLEKITPDTLDPLGFIEKHLFASELLMLNAEEDFELTRDLDLGATDVFLNAPSFNNPEFIFKTKSFKGRFKELFKVGHSNEKLGLVATCQGEMDVEADEIDARYGKIFSRGKGRLISLVKDLRVGDYVEGQEESMTPGSYPGSNATFFKKRSTNGSFVISNNELYLYGPNTQINYTTIHGGSTTVQSLVENQIVSSNVSSGQNIIFKGKKTHITRGAQHECSAYCMTPSNRSHSIVISFELSPESIVQSLNNIYFECAQNIIEASSILSTNSIYQDSNIIASKDQEYKDVPGVFELKTRPCKDDHSRCGSPCSKRTSCGHTPAYVKAGSEVCVNTGAVVLQGGANALKLTLRGKTLSMDDSNQVHYDPEFSQSNIIIDLIEVSKELYKNNGFFHALDDGRVVTEHELSGGYLPGQITLLQSDIPGLNPSSFSNPTADQLLIHGLPFEFLMQKVMSDYLGKLHKDGYTGRDLLNLFHKNTKEELLRARARRAEFKSPYSLEYQRKLQEENTDLLTEEDLQYAIKSCITYEAKKINDQVMLGAKLILAPNDINIFNTVNDIVSTLDLDIKSDETQEIVNKRLVSESSVNVLGGKDQFFKDSTILGKKKVNLKSQGGQKFEKTTIQGTGEGAQVEIHANDNQDFKQTNVSSIGTSDISSQKDQTYEESTISGDEGLKSHAQGSFKSILNKTTHVYDDGANRSVTQKAGQKNRFSSKNGNVDLMGKKHYEQTATILEAGKDILRGSTDGDTDI